MRPFRAVALGLVVVVLTVVVGRVDLLADPVGWALVALGVRALPPGYPLRVPTTVVVVVALATSVPLAVPMLRDALTGAGTAVGWAVGLPALVALGSVAHGAATAALLAGEPGPSALYRTVEVGVVLVALLPLPVLALGVEQLALPAALLVVLVPLVLLVALLSHSGRAWAGAPAPTPAPDTTPES